MQTDVHLHFPRYRRGEIVEPKRGNFSLDQIKFARESLCCWLKQRVKKSLYSEKRRLCALSFRDS